jgi:hypothetical protein
MPKNPRLIYILPAISFCIYLAGRAPFLGQWDSFDYLKQIVSHQLSALGIGRPVYLAYNILLWESSKKIFHLRPLQVETVAMWGTVVLGALGVLLFLRLALRMLPTPAGQMATVALAVSPVYAIYAGYIMTEVPMLVALFAAALFLWKQGDRYPLLTDIAGGICFGLAVGIREQALTLGAAFLWIIFSRRRDMASRVRSTLLFGAAAAFAVLSPAVAFYLHDPAGFTERIKTWLHAIPMGSIQFRNNLEASLLFAFLASPGAWVALAGAGIYKLIRKRNEIPAARDSQAGPIAHPVWGMVCCLVLPLAVLWRDADVQMHPRYALIALPASVIFCTVLFRRWVPSRRGIAVWAIVQIAVFGLSLAVFAPFRRTQVEKIDFARQVREAVPGKGLLIAGNYSPVFDYYRGIGVRPEWQILWAGWDWDRHSVESKIDDAWANGTPVYLSTDAPGWSYFEREFIEVHLMLKNCPKKQIIPYLYRVFPTAGTGVPPNAAY